jgi:acyl-CoA reductase-like NAD-dependent aldehyde dehydrogenase
VRRPGWAGATAYNRGQVLYRVAEVMEGRRAQFVRGGPGQRGSHRRRKARPCLAGHRPLGLVCRVVRQAPQVLGGLNPVAGPYFDISAPEPTGVVAVLAPQESSLLGLVSR